MKKVKYELIKISETTTTDKFFKEILKETDPNYEFVTGVMFHNYAGAGDTIRVGMSTTSGGRVINPVPFALLNMDAQNRNFEDQFIPVNLPARGEAINAIIDGNTITTAFKGDFVLRLENAKKEAKRFQLYHKQLTIKSGETNYESGEIILPSGYSNLKGVWLNTLSAQRVGIRTGGNYIMDPLPALSLQASKYVPYDKRFYPINEPCPKVITVDVESLATPGADIVFDLVLLLT